MKSNEYRIEINSKKIFRILKVTFSNNNTKVRRNSFAKKKNKSYQKEYK